ncbi:hypothetical protein P7L91_10985 [Bisgaard Taxon 10/6]|uniref:hypothetical protein n=1 Tax=Exercitatus varius TaxID=67857 RepID=UPI00294ABC7F|nr:hypothetical protein [Exercitatus varius]MDG2961356.1 hypothetical protein [Exercitatus varius]
MMSKFLLKTLLFANIIIQAKFSYANILFEKSEYGISIKCESNDTLNYYECMLQDIKNKESDKIIINSYYCPYLSMNMEKKDILQVGCHAAKYISSYFSYKKENNNWFLFKYEYLHGPETPEDEGDSFIIDSNYLKGLKRSLFSDFKEYVISYGIVNKKTYLYTDKNKKTPMYLINGDKVLILDKSNKNNNIKYRVYYQGKKDIDAWIDGDNIDIK